MVALQASRGLREGRERRRAPLHLLDIHAKQEREPAARGGQKPPLRGPVVAQKHFPWALPTPLPADSLIKVTLPTFSHCSPLAQTQWPLHISQPSDPSIIQ